jgi:hypothetical protein
MKQFISYFIYLIAISSCSNKYYPLIGEYYVIGKDYKKTLILNSDSTFIFTQSSFETTSKCKGQFTIIAKDTFLLKCFDESFPSQITSGYMNDRIKKVVILKGNKLKLNKTILSHKNS